ncbi:hypothetical protein [Streptomyces sp. CB00072]|uniref:hypothetical protein n=1 Tax=Streptomyces sp. CB00072 TaxID=1703928 RepID=UPI0011611394|nr:hypothetical protein [Streptomyces sp. CB00072]
MDTGDVIATTSAAVALLAAGFSWRQTKHAKGQVITAQEQVVIAQQQLEHAEKAHREQNEPYVVVDIQPSDPASGVLVVVVENIGTTIARNVRITADPPLESGWGADLTAMLQRALSHTFPMLPPGRRLEFLFDEQERFQNADLPTGYTFTVRCEGPYGPMEDLEYIVDFGTWAESLVGQRPLKKVEDKLGKIQDSLGSLADAYRKSHAPAIREEGERIVRAHRERMARRAQQSGNTPPEDPGADAPEPDGTAPTDPSAD